MKIEKYKDSNWFCYYYFDSKTNTKIGHGLYNSWYDIGVGYGYHVNKKGFWLKYED